MDGEGIPDRQVAVLGARWYADIEGEDEGHQLPGAKRRRAAGLAAGPARDHRGEFVMGDLAGELADHVLEDDDALDSESGMSGIEGELERIMEMGEEECGDGEEAPRAGLADVADRAPPPEPELLDVGMPPDGPVIAVVGAPPDEPVEGAAPPPPMAVPPPPAEPPPPPLPPPLEPPPPALPVARGPRRGGLVAHPAYSVDVRGDGRCIIRHDTVQKQWGAHCRLPAHGHLCRLNRTLKERAGNPAQGRPLGFLLAWLQSAGDFESKEEHMQLGRSPHFILDERMSHRTRVRARVWLRDAEPDVYRELTQLEREQQSGEGIEPEGWP